MSTTEDSAVQSNGFAAIEAFVFGKVALAAGITQRCDDADRAERMNRAVSKFCEQLELESADETLSELQRRSLEWSRLERRMLLVDLWSVDAFSPYDIKVSKSDQRAELHDLALSIDAGGAVGEIDRCARELRNSARFKSAAKIGGALAAGALVLGGAGFLAAPFIGTYLGASAGLAGAAATNAGLAAIGGGSLAAGGGGMAAGVMFVAGGGAAIGGVVAGGGTAMYQLGARQAQIELRKMELKFKVALLHTQAALLVAKQFARHLDDEISGLQRQLDEERLYSEKRSRRISSLERMLKQFRETKSWMTEELDDAAS
jgi:hypothetical protein